MYKRQAEDYSYQRRDQDGDNGRQARDGNAILGEEADRVGDGEADDDADQASDEGDENRFGEKLEADLAVGGAHRLADSDLTRTGTDRGQHDIHEDVYKRQSRP